MNDLEQPYDDNYWVIEAWKAAVRLTVDIDKIFSNFTDHYISRDLMTITLDLSSHISHGFEERNPTRSIGWLRKAKQLCTTIRTRLYLAREMMVVNKNTIEKLIEQAREVATLLSKSMEITKDIQH
ncbi:MAG: four helix bundle protein [Bacteroidales bacterium]|nr:four helix bundle protein [Bacteroidales bacterium]